jgi:hypothetical protein
MSDVREGHLATDENPCYRSYPGSGDVRPARVQNTASAGFQPDTNLNTIRSLVPGKTVSVALSSSAIFAAN